MGCSNTGSGSTRLKRQRCGSISCRCGAGDKRHVGGVPPTDGGQTTVAQPSPATGAFRQANCAPKNNMPGFFRCLPADPPTPPLSWTTKTSFLSFSERGQPTDHVLCAWYEGQRVTNSDWRVICGNRRMTGLRFFDRFFDRAGLPRKKSKRMCRKTARFPWGSVYSTPAGRNPFIPEAIPTFRKAVQPWPRADVNSNLETRLRSPLPLCHTWASVRPRMARKDEVRHGSRKSALEGGGGGWLGLAEPRIP